MQPFVFALPNQLGSVSGSTTQVQITFGVVAGNGSNPTIGFLLCFTWDGTLPVATNISSLKTAIVSQVASVGGITVSTSNVIVLMGVN